MFKVDCITSRLSPRPYVSSCGSVGSLVVTISYELSVHSPALACGLCPSPPWSIESINLNFPRPDVSATISALGSRVSVLFLAFRVAQLYLDFLFVHVLHLAAP